MTNEVRLPPAQTITEVVDRIDAILDEAVANRDRVGLFAALYRHVATTFEEAIAERQFAYPELISRLDVVFFNRYLEALEQFQSGEPCSRCWRVAFEAARDKRPIVVQHLAMGMNAHIRFDLAIAVADAIPAHKLPDFRPDFERMNDLLASLLDDVMEDLGHIWRLLGPVDRLLGNADETVINFSMREARKRAWDHALKLAASDEQQRPEIQAQTDREVAMVQELLYHPAFPLSWGLWLVRLGERGDVAYQINAMRHTQAVDKQRQRLRHSIPVPEARDDRQLAESVPPPRPGAAVSTPSAQA